MSPPEPPASAAVPGSTPVRGVPEKLIFSDSIHALYRPMKASDPSVLVVAALLCLALSGYYQWWELVAWFIGVWLTLSGLLTRPYMNKPGAKDTPERWARYYLINGTIRALYWGLSVLYFVDPAQPEIQFSIALVLGGTASGIIAVQAFYPPMMLSYLLCLTVPFVVRMLLIGDLLHVYMGAGVLLMTVYLMYYGFFHARTLRRTIILRHENVALVEQLREQAVALQQANEAKSQFFAAASHDLRQPLHALSYYTSLLRPHAQDAPHVERIEQCAGALDDLLAGVLDISRIDAGRIKPSPRPVALDELLGRLGSLYLGAAAAKGLELRLHVPPLWTHSDPALLQRVVSNLLSNALRYTSSGGVLLALRRRGDQLRLQVHDTGVGIALEAQGQIFDDFVQLGNPQRDPSRGVGLGLATVRRLCAVLGHRITVRSAPGRGSCFELLLPHIEPPVAAETPQAEPPDHSLLHGRVLVVEDHELVRDSLMQTLSSWALACDAAADGMQALALAKQHAYEAVLCDWRLPGQLDGLQVLAALRPLQPGMRLYALVTGEPTDSLGPVPEGVVVLHKPIRPIRLRALLTAHLSRSDAALKRLDGGHLPAP